MDIQRDLALGKITIEEAAEKLGGGPIEAENLRSSLRWICALADRYPHLYRLTRAGTPRWSEVEPLLTPGDRIEDEEMLSIVARRIDDVMAMPRAGTYETDAPAVDDVNVEETAAIWRFERDSDRRRRARDATMGALFPDRRGGKVLVPRGVTEAHDEAVRLLEDIEREVLSGGMGLGSLRPADPELAAAIDLKFRPVLPRWNPANLSPAFRDRIRCSTAGELVVRVLTMDRGADAVAIDLIALALHHQSVDERTVRDWVRG